MEADAFSQSIADGGAAEPQFSVLIVSTVRFQREAVREFLRRDPAFSISALAGDLEAAVAIVHDRQPDIILLDAAFPEGIDLINRIRQIASRTLVIALAVAETEEEIVSWAQAGVAGYIPSGAALDDLAPFLAKIIRGEQPCSGRAAAGLLRRVANVEHADDLQIEEALLPHMLTAREQQIVRLIDAGLSNKDIARRLNIEVATTKSHVHNLLSKLHLQRRGQISSWMRDLLRRHPQSLARTTSTVPDVRLSGRRASGDT